MSKQHIPPFLQYYDSPWVAARLQAMTTAQKLGQLFQVAAFSNRDQAHEEHILSLVRDYHIGGLTFFQDDALRQAELTNRYQAAASTPLFVNIDAEWGLGMRLKNALRFPYQMALGAVQDDTLVYRVGERIGAHCRRLGLHSALAPVVDVNNNPDNPVINYRSFGENPQRVAYKALQYMRGLQQHRILDCAKHFPGHGDTAADSHLELPVLPHSSERLHAVELYPFKALMAEGLSAVMTAHLQIPAWDDRPHMPATLSEPISGKLLRQELGFQGLVITDAMDMKGITNHYPAGEADCMAILAGNDIITNSESVPRGIEQLERALQDGRLSMEQLDHKVRRILAMKQWAGLEQYAPIQLEGLLEDLHDADSLALNQELARAIVTEARAQGPALPLRGRLASLHVRSGQQTTVARDVLLHHLGDMAAKPVENLFADMLQAHAPGMDHYYWQESDGLPALEALVARLQDYEQVVVGVHGVNIKPLNHFDLPMPAMPLLRQLAAAVPVALVLFGNAYALNLFGELPATVLVTYQENADLQQAAADVLFGTLEPMGVLPVSLD